MKKITDKQLYSIRGEINAITPARVIDPLPPQPSILRGPSMRLHARAVRKLIRVTRNRVPGGEQGINWVENFSSLILSQKNTVLQRLEFTVRKKPLVSIVIPVYNKFPLTVQCLASLHENVSSEISYEVIVVDNNSTDASKNLSRVKGLVYIRNQENLGFVGGCNRGVEAAKGQYIVFLNNDASVEPGWLENLVSTIESYPNAGLVGSKILYPDGRLQEAGGIIYKDGTGCNYGKNDHPDRYQYNFVREVDYCSGASIIIKKDLFDEFGGFDELYAPAYYEDTDLAFKVREKGLKVIYQPESVIYHIEGATAGTSTSSGFKQYQEINHKKFLARWKDVLKREHFSETDFFKARDRNSAKTVLIVDEHIPKPDEDSGSVRMRRIIESYQDLGYKVVFFPNYSKKQLKYMKPLQQSGVEVIYGEVRLSDWLMTYGFYVDVVMLSRPRIGSYYMDISRALCPNATIVYDTVDLHYLRLRRQAEFETGSLRTYLVDMANKHEILEKHLLQKADVGLVVSSTEVELLEQEGLKNIVVVSNIHEIAEKAYEKTFEQRQDLLFVGGFAHQPNVDAIRWFVDDILPKIVNKNRSIRLHIVGSHMSDDLRLYLEKQINVIVHGFVENIDPMLTSARVFVAPLRYGAGVKGKIGQAIEYGIPIVSTAVGGEGMHLEDGVSYLNAELDQDFANAVLRLYTDRSLWLKLQGNAKLILDTRFSKTIVEQTLKTLLKH